jgi:hypothetical protein
LSINTTATISNLISVASTGNYYFDTTWFIKNSAAGGVTHDSKTWFVSAVIKTRITAIALQGTGHDYVYELDVISFTGTKLANDSGTYTKYEVGIKEFPIYFVDLASNADYAFKLNNNWLDTSGFQISSGTIAYKYLLGDVKYTDL